MRSDNLDHSDQSGSLELSGKRYVLDGLMTLEHFCDLRTHFYTSSFQDYESQADILDARTRAFD